MKWIFYPSINYERIEDPTAPNHYNCPIVATYPEVIAGNMDDVFEENGVTFSHPFIPYDNDEFLAREMYKVLKRSGVTRTHVEYAVKPETIRRKPLFWPDVHITWTLKSIMELIRLSAPLIWLS